MSAELIRRFKEARRAQVPIVAIETPDPAQTISVMLQACNGGAPRLSWDIGAGLVGLNDSGRKLATELTGGAMVREPDSVLRLAVRLPENTILFFHNAHRFIDNVVITQLIWNLRDLFKEDKRTLVLLGVMAHIPAELKNDVIRLDEPLPDDAELNAICWRQVEAIAGLDWTPDEKMMSRAAAALKGCSAFAAEQLFAMAAGKEQLNLDDLNQAVQGVIEQTPGLSYDSGPETFDVIGGLEAAKRYGRLLFNGPRRPAVVVRVEELEKAMAGASGDTSGTSSDILQIILSEMEDNGWTGILAYGVPGSGKSLYSKALANTFKARPLRLDANACKDKHVGESGKQIRAALKVIKTIGGKNVFFIASVNKLDTLPPELQRRFRAGVWFFDAPTAADRKAIWEINRRAFSIPDGEPSPDEEGLTGADIRNICEQSYALGLSLADAREFTVPMKFQSPDAIASCRALAHDRFLDANNGGKYQDPAKASKAPAEGKRVRKMSA